MDSQKQVILVDKNDNQIGIMEKQAAHEKGELHRAFSIFLFNDKNEMLLQQRAAHKYHSAELWSNSCCSHPRPNENVLDAANRRLKEELGIESELIKAFAFTYQSELSNGLIEHEFDHVFMGIFNGNCQINPEEVKAYKFVSLAALEKELVDCPEKYSQWFKLILPKIIMYRNKLKAA